MANRYQALNQDANASEVDPTNRSLAGSTSETPQQIADRLTANNSLPTTTVNPGPANISLEYDCNLTTGSILIKGDVPPGTRLAITAVSGNTLLLANAQNAVLDGGTPYGFGAYNNTYASGILNAQWAFGPRNLVSGSGITGERLKISLTDASGRWLLDVAFTPKTLTGKVLCRRVSLATPTTTPSPTQDPAGTSTATSTGTPTPSPTPTPTPTVVVVIPTSAIGLDVVGTYSTDNGGRLVIRAHGATDTNYQLKIESLGTPFTLSNSQNSTIPNNTFVGWGPSGNSDFPMDWTFWGVTAGQPVRLTFTHNGSTEVVPAFTPSVGTKTLLRTSIATGTNTNTATTPGTNTATATSTGTSTQLVPAYSQSVPYANSAKSSFRSNDGGTHMDTFITSADYADFSLTGVPFTAANYNVEITYQTNWASGTGEGAVVVNGVTRTFPLVGAEGGTRRYTVTVPLTQGNNTVRVQGGTNVFQYPSISVSRAASTETVGGGGGSTSTGGTSVLGSSTATQTQATVTVPAGTVDADGFLIYDDQGWGNSDIKRIENNELFLEFKQSVGACVTGAGQKSNNRSVVSDQQVTPNGVTFSDKGVQWQVSPYAWPAGNLPLTIGGETRGGTGDNAVQGGSANPYFQPGIVEKSRIVQTSDRGVVACFRVRGLLWDWFSVPGHMPVDLEWWFKPGKVICYRFRLHVEPRPGNWSGQQKFQSLSQELMCLYNIGHFNQHIARINGQEINLRDGVPLDGQSNDYFTSGCYAATYSPDRSEGVLYYTPRNSIFKSWQKFAEDGEWRDQGQAYINAGVKRTYDIAGTTTIDSGYIILGSQTEAMAAMQTLEPIDQSYNFDFTSLDNQWWNEDARVMRNSNGSLRFYCGDEKTDNGQTNTFGRFLSPCRAWQASSFNFVEFDMTVSGVSHLQLAWAKPGKFGQFEYKAPITVTGDGTRRRYQFQLKDLPNWSGEITYLGLQAAESGKPAAFADMWGAQKISAITV